MSGRENGKDITSIKETMGLDSLPDNLKEMALLRLGIVLVRKCDLLYDVYIIKIREGIIKWK